MDKLDRLVWATGLSFKCHGLRIGIRVSNGETMNRVLETLPPGWNPEISPVVDRLYSFVVGGISPRSRARRFNLLYAGPVLLSRTHDTQETLQALESDLRMYVAERARGKMFVHAGVVAWHGRAIVIPGRSYSGKSTLVAALVRAGATYYSDEYAVFDSHGHVHPYPVPLQIRTEPDGPGQKLDIEMHGGSVGKGPLPVGAIVVTRYEPGAGWRPRLASPGQGVLALLANTVAARRRPAQALRRFSLVAATAPVYRGTRGEADEVARSLLSKEVI